MIHLLLNPSTLLLFPNPCDLLFKLAYRSSNMFAFLCWYHFCQHCIKQNMVPCPPLLISYFSVFSFQFSPSVLSGSSFSLSVFPQFILLLPLFHILHYFFFFFFCCASPLSFPFFIPCLSSLHVYFFLSVKCLPGLIFLSLT